MSSIRVGLLEEEVKGGLRGSPLVNSYISAGITSCATLT